jgi:large subunit ribosomal protein L10
MWSVTKVNGFSLNLSPISHSSLPSQVLKPFLEDSKYQNLLPLFVGHNLLLVSEEPKVKEMVRILKAVPFLPLLGEQVAVPEGGEMGWVPQSLVPSARNILSLMEPESTA